MLFDYSLMIVDVGDIYIKLIVSENKMIIKEDSIRTPEGAVLNNNIQDGLAIAEKINDFKVKNNLQVKNIIFVIEGQDIVVRHLEVPIMKTQEIEKSVKWEISQSLPEQGNDYYIDFEIADKIENDEKKVYKILAVAAPKEKIDKCAEIAEKLNMKLKAVDIEANCISRVFSKLYEKNKNEESIAVVEIGENESRIIILNKGKLFIERELFFGINNIINQLKMKLSMTDEETDNYLKDKINLAGIDENNENELRIKGLFDNVFASFEKAIQFFYTGKSQKNLDKVYVIEDGTAINGIKEYVSNFLSADTEIVDNKFNVPVKIKDHFETKNYLSLVGALFRNNKSTELNLLPYKLKNKVYVIQKQRRIGAVFGSAVLILLIIAVSLKFYEHKLQDDENKIQQQIRSDAKVITENTKLVNEKQQYLKQISLVNALEKSKVYNSEWLEEIVEQLPADVSVNSIGKDNNQTTLSVQGAAKDINSISKYSVNLQNSGSFTNVKIVSISQDSSSGYKFSISVKEVVKK